MIFHLLLLAPVAEPNQADEYRALIYLRLVANTKSLFQISYRVNMPATPGFHLTQKRSRKPLAPTLEATRISERPKRRFPQSSKRSSRDQKRKFPNGQLSGFAGVARYDRIFASLMPNTSGSYCSSRLRLWQRSQTRLSLLLSPPILQW